MGGDDNEGGGGNIQYEKGKSISYSLMCIGGMGGDVVELGGESVTSMLLIGCMKTFA